MNENYLTPKEFAQAAGVSVQTIYKQMNSRLSPYVITVKGKKKIAAAALQEFYENEEQPKQPETTVKQPETTVKEEKTTKNQPNSTFENQPNSTENQPKADLEKRIEELESLLHKQIEEDKQEKEFLRDQIRQKDKTIENLTENLKIAQQLAAADKKKLLEIEQRQQDQQGRGTVEADQMQEEEVITPAADTTDQAEEERPEGRVKSFLRRFLHL